MKANPRGWELAGGVRRVGHEVHDDLPEQPRIGARDNGPVDQLLHVDASKLTGRPLANVMHDRGEIDVLDAAAVSRLGQIARRGQDALDAVEGGLHVDERVLYLPP